jgi:hypothetical protein
MESFTPFTWFVLWLLIGWLLWSLASYYTRNAVEWDSLAEWLQVGVTCLFLWPFVLACTIAEELLKWWDE